MSNFCCSDCQRLPAIEFVQGESFDKVLTILGVDGNPLAFQGGATANFWIKSILGADVVSFVCTILPSPAIGQVRIQLNFPQSAILEGLYNWGGGVDNGTQKIRLAANHVRVRR